MWHSTASQTSVWTFSVSHGTFGCRSTLWSVLLVEPNQQQSIAAYWPSLTWWERRGAAEIKSIKNGKGCEVPLPPLPPVCHFERAGASPTHLKAGQRPLTALHQEPAEVKASEARGCICLDLAHWRCKVCDPSTLRVLICLRKAPGHLQICKNVMAAGRLRVPSSGTLMAPLLKASFASCGVFIFTSRVPVITYKCCCHLVQLFTECPYRRGPGSRGPEGAVIIVLLLLSWRERRENDLFSIWSCQYEPVRLLWYFAEINGRPATMMPQTWSALPSQLGP